MCRSRSDKLSVLIFIGLFILVFSQTGLYRKYSECRERYISGECCYNFHLVGNKCEPCPPGSWGHNCENACPSGSYGYLCVKICKDCTTSECHPVYGCKKLKNSSLKTTLLLSTYSEKSSRIFKNTIHSSPHVSLSPLTHVSISTRISTPSSKVRATMIIMFLSQRVVL
ncbi:uncharacterized protein LOC134259861 isoform X2 [Saccostrea cucullata]|uniref:uncharacterized protein LOC134259861 isoform X2 n=1 Tax=Saccostrea cuccullata TaxID=36930 RepID=UPI002ED6245A